MRPIPYHPPSCAGCLGSGMCWVCLGTGYLGGDPNATCHRCLGSSFCAEKSQQAGQSVVDTETDAPTPADERRPAVICLDVALPSEASAAS